MSSGPGASFHRGPDVVDGSATSVISPGTHVDVTSDQVAVDILATATFNDAQKGPEREIGYFGVTKPSSHELNSRCLPGYIGPTSNHALFRSLSDSFAHITRLHLSSQQHPMEDTTRIHSGFTRSPPPVLRNAHEQNVTRKVLEPVDQYALPGDEHLTLLINQYFDTAGMAMPYISKSVLLCEYHRAPQENLRGLSRPMRALLNIICAFASSTISNGDTEIYYHRALGLLDERTLRGSSLELSQFISESQQCVLTVEQFRRFFCLAISSRTISAPWLAGHFMLLLSKLPSSSDFTRQDSTRITC